MAPGLILAFDGGSCYYGDNFYGSCETELLLPLYPMVWYGAIGPLMHRH